jgi:type IV pilus assembly protein PilE
MQKITGFNLLELMITLSIVGILFAISLPIYSEHIVREKRLEAEMNLIKLANALEKYFFLNNTYEDATLSRLNFSDKIADKQYQLQIVSATHSTFLINAIPLGNQAKKDVLCRTLSLDSVGNKKMTGSGSLAECWH